MDEGGLSQMDVVTVYIVVVDLYAVTILEREEWTTKDSVDLRCRSGRSLPFPEVLGRPGGRSCDLGTTQRTLFCPLQSLRTSLGATWFPSGSGKSQ